MTDYLKLAKDALRHALGKHDLESVPVWFCKTADNWKAILITDDPCDHMIYEVTGIGGSAGKIIVDEYEKISKITMEVNYE